ncbi:uncharacterized protein [Spinacia oleracea]|uniref:Uncharacterized protein n=1 Tax=Spinacia oleracea TaxID=3562 RepID=A0ABM3QYX5_SPIOL|nr:uncharacterized protein LOC130463416 [Spinacia oleracea]
MSVSQVAYLLKNGHLKDFMYDKARGVVDKDISNSPSKPPPPPYPKTVNFIAGGSDICGDTPDRHHDELVISIPVGNCMIKRVLVDNGSSTNVMMLDALKEMRLNLEKDVTRKSIVLVGFSSEEKTTFVEVFLPVYPHGVNQQVKLCVINCPSSYNIILGSIWIHDMKAIPSTYHQTIKFPTRLAAQQIKEINKNRTSATKKP